MGRNIDLSEKGEVVCPHCGSKEVKQLMSTFMAHTASKT
jgi:DNA-directed RNA polymerase subunit RPC12/RpoP